MGSCTSGSAMGTSDIGGPGATYQGDRFPVPDDDFFGDGLFLVPHNGSEIYGGLANLYFRNSSASVAAHQAQMSLQSFGTGGSARTFTALASGQFVFSIADASDFYRTSFDQQLAPFSELMLQGPGDYSYASPLKTGRVRRV